MKKYWINISLVSLILVLFSSTELAAKEYEKVQIRNGIPNFYNKIEKGDTIRIVYFGGSITNAAGWRIKSFQWFHQKYPNNTFIQVNASIGGTGSNLGAFRFEKDVLAHKPDLILMEYAVNDSRTPGLDIKRQYEGILRKLWTALPNTDICFVYTLKEEFAEAYNSGELPYTVVAAENIADYYKVPSVNFGIEIMERVNNKTLLFKGAGPNEGEIPCFSKDGVHPFNQTGHQLYFEDFQAFEIALSNQKNKRTQKHKRPKPLDKNNWENARNFPLNQLVFNGDWKFPDKKNKLYETNSPGASVAFEFEGTMFGIYDWIGPIGCAVEISIDGESQRKLRFDSHCTYNRANYFFISGLENGNHKVEIKLEQPLTADEKIEILKQRIPDAEKHKDKLGENRFRLKTVMIL